MLNEALTEYRRQIPLAGGNLATAAGYADQLTSALKMDGAEGYWRKRLELSAPAASLEKAEINARLGQNAAAFSALELAYKQHDMWLVTMRVDPKWDKVRSDPRFSSLLQREGLN